MPPDNHYLPLLLPTLLGAGLFLVIVVVFVIILVVLLRKLQNLQREQASLLQAAHQRQTSFMHPPSARVPAQSPYMGAQPVFTQHPASGRMSPTPPMPVPIQNMQEAVQKNSLLDDRRWLSLVEDNIGIYDELDRHMEDFDGQRRQLAEHVLLRLEEILARSGVSLIQGETAFDRHRHQPVPVSASVAPGAPILETLRPGFAVDGRILRRAHVRA